MKIIPLLIIPLISLSCTRYQSTDTLILEDLNESYEVVKEIPYFPNAEGAYVFDEDKIYIKEGVRQKNYIMLHELIHKYRKDIRIEDAVIEEHVCVKAAYSIGKRLGLQLKMGKYDLPDLITDTLRDNGLEPRFLNSEERQLIKKEIEKTRDIFVKKMKEKGRNMKDIDWMRTAILLLL